HMIEPTTQHENEQVTRLNQHIKGRTPLPSGAGEIVESDRKRQHGIPEQDLRPNIEQKQRQERKLPDSDFPSQSCQLLCGSARTEKKRALPWVAGICLGVNDIVDAVEHQAERNQRIEKAHPKNPRAVKDLTPQ